MDRRAGTGLALEADEAAALADGAVDAGEAESGSLPVRLGGEERLEGPRGRLGVHPVAAVDDREDAVGAGGDLLLAGLRLAELDGAGPDRQRAAGRHRVAGVQGEVDEGRLDPRRVDADEDRLGGRLHDQLDRLAEQVLEQAACPRPAR